MVSLLITFVLVGCAGLWMTQIGATVTAGLLKVGSVTGICVIAVLGYANPLMTAGFCAMMLGEVLLSVISPILKKDVLFYAGLGSYMLAYAVTGIGLLDLVTFKPYEVLVVSILVALVVLQLQSLDKATGNMKLILGAYLGVLSFLTAVAFLYSPVAGVGMALVYLCDSIIGHSKFDGKYALPDWLTETLITVPFTVGLALVAFAAL